jgi:hypothetical protein
MHFNSQRTCLGNRLLSLHASLLILQPVCLLDCGLGIILNSQFFERIANDISPGNDPFYRHAEHGKERLQQRVADAAERYVGAMTARLSGRFCELQQWRKGFVHELRAAASQCSEAVDEANKERCRERFKAPWLSQKRESIK